MRRTVLGSVLLLPLLAATTGCSRYYWSKPGATAEQFTQDSQTCVRHAATALPVGASAEAVEQFYRACLNSRGYVRDKQYDPPPPGSYRGIEDTRQFTAAAQAVASQAPPQSFEQQLTQLDDLKARGRITDAEYAAMRQRLVEGVTPGALTAPPPAPPPPVTAPQPSLTGRWYGRDNSVLDIRADGRQLAWDWERNDRVTARASGTGSVAGEQVSLVGRSTGIGLATSLQPFSFSLTWDGSVLQGTATGANNLPRGVEFRRERP